MDTREQILQFIRTRGPVLPVQIAKEINTNILMASAYLSELSSNKKIKVSNLKIGSSPLYYLPGQEIRLQSFSNNLNDKERKAFEMIRDKKILRHSELEPALRVMLQSLKDFAMPLQVDYHGKTEIFWKWYLTDDKEVEQTVKESVTPKEDNLQEETTGVKEEIKQEAEIKKEGMIGNKVSERQKILEIKKDDKRRLPVLEVKTSLLDKRIEKLFLKNNMQIIEENVDVNKGNIVRIQSSIGPLNYYCRIFNKKKISEGDISLLYINAQSLRLSSILVTPGQLTKKAKEMVENDLKGIVILNY